MHFTYFVYSFAYLPSLSAVNNSALFLQILPCLNQFHNSFPHSEHRDEKLSDFVWGFDWNERIIAFWTVFVWKDSFIFEKACVFMSVHIEVMMRWIPQCFECVWVYRRHSECFFSHGAKWKHHSHSKPFSLSPLLSLTSFKSSQP